MKDMMGRKKEVKYVSQIWPNAQAIHAHRDNICVTWGRAGEVQSIRLSLSAGVQKKSERMRRSCSVLLRCFAGE